MANPKKGGKMAKSSTPNIVMSDDQWLALRMQALKERTSASEIIRRLVADYLKKVKKGAK
jgi:hypothetical protein